MTLENVKKAIYLNNKVLLSIISETEKEIKDILAKQETSDEDVQKAITDTLLLLKEE